MEKHIVTGIYNMEIFIARVQDNGKVYWDVLRHVSKSDLEDRRDPDEIKEYYRDLWKEAVRAGATEDSLDEYVEEVIAESDMDNNEEMYPGKDESDCEYLTPDLREEADAFMLEHEYIEIGTWESSGGYAPNTHRLNDDADFEDWDYVFNTPEAKEQAAAYVKSLKK